MQNNLLKVTRERGKLFNTLTFLVQTDNIVTYMCSSLRDVLVKFGIPEVRIKDICFKKIENNKDIFSITIKYLKTSMVKFKSNDKVGLIRTALKCMGYSDADIKSIYYRKYWSNSEKKIWVVTLYDSDYDFSPDASYSESSYSLSIIKELEEFLGFEVIIHFI